MISGKARAEKATADTEGGALILALQRAAHSTLHALGTRLAGEDLTASEINALALLADGQARAVGELASASGTKPTTLTSLLDRLARRGYLVRDLDPADRRSFLVSLTDQGRPVAQAARAAMSGLEAERLGAVSAAELAGFRAVVRALSEAAES
ncbi:MAG TPA: MarR family transcriptional regulator [Streptosporangiaceae bacterium]|nr:MarR family transcriptional regulator [Streptosporangiaceae bacterium]